MITNPPQPSPRRRGIVCPKGHRTKIVRTERFEGFVRRTRKCLRCRETFHTTERVVRAF